MIISVQEKLMYGVMKAIYDSGIPMNFKGSMVLKACLLEAGYSEETRHTVDIDCNWNSDNQPTSEQIAESLQKAMDMADAGLKVTVFRQYGEGRSAGFEVKSKDSGETVFTMDVDVNRPLPPLKMYEIDGMRFRGVSPAQMTADKIYVISTDKVFRRIKDVVDLYYISKVFSFDKDEILEILRRNGKILDSFEGFINQIDKLKHSYDKFRFEGGVNKPRFEEVYNTVKVFIQNVLY